jgi:flagellar basal-body rod protein FlgB
MIDFIETGIKAEGLRQKAIANNVANLQTPGYRRYDVQFRELLSKALSSSGDVDFDSIEPELFNPMLTDVQKNGNDVVLEYEVGEMVKNSVRHTAYIRILKKKYQQMELAMSVK